MKISVVPRGPLTWCCVVAAVFLSIGHICQANQVDWTRYCVDGVQLTGNNDTRYLKADPVVDLTVHGQLVPDAGRVFDSYHNTALSWQSAKTLDMTVDLRHPRLISGIVVAGKAKAWELATSRDGQTWYAVPSERMWPSGSAAGSLAAAARYIRVQAEPLEGQVSISEIYVFGEKEASTKAVGGIYPSRYPPVVKEPIRLRAVVRNTTDRPIRHLKVVFEQDGSDLSVLGDTVIDQLDARTATVASIAWTPAVTEPHHITVRVSADALPAGQAASKVIPVVNRAIYLTGFNPHDNERLIHYNLYTTVGGVESYMAWLHGKIALMYTPGPCPVKGKSVDYWESEWGRLLERPDCDGLAIDEFATISAGGSPEPGGWEALKLVYERYPDKTIAPWLIGDMDAPGRRIYQHTDLILSELNSTSIC